MGIKIKIEHHICECCGVRVFWRYKHGKKVLLNEDIHKESMNIYPKYEHTCFWE